MLQNITFKNKCCFEIYSHQKILKNIYDGSHKNIKQQLFFLFVLKEMLLEQHEGLKDHVTLKTGVMAAENSALPSQKLITFKIY